MAEGARILGRRTTLEDVAREAGVSLATADRVVNQRDGVRGQTIARVELAVAKLGYRANIAAMRLARNESYRFAFILPSNANSFMSNLASQVERASDWLASQSGYIDVMHVDVFDPNALAGRHGKVGVIVGSMSLRDHAERHFGFNQVLSSEYRDLVVLPAREGRDDGEQTRALTAALLNEHSDLIGLYNAGAGNEGIATALEAFGRTQDVVWIAHELTAGTRRFLLCGLVDAIINQDPGHEARSAARVLLAHCLGEPINPDQERIRIEIFLRDNLP